MHSRDSSPGAKGARDAIRGMIHHSVASLRLDPGRRPTIIIGAGTVGLYAAVELCRRGRDVLVIEGGDEHLGNFDPASFESIGRPHATIRIGRSRSLGGTSNLWGGQLVEYQPVDFAGREWLPDSRWPISYDEVARYHRRTYENLGVPAKWLDDREVLRQVGVRVPAFPEGVELFLTRWMRLPSMAATFREEIHKNARLNVLLRHTVTGFSGADGRITSVEVADGKGARQQVSGGSFVLAAGTIEIARLLLHAAGSPGWQCPWRDNRNVGLFFQDHLGGRVAELQPCDHRRFMDLFSTIVIGGSKFLPKLRLTNETLEHERLLNLHAMVFCESSIQENLVFLKQFLKAAIYSRRISGVGGLARNMVACGRHLPPLMWRYLVENRVFVPTGSRISLQVQSEQVPLASSRITLDSSRCDALGLPKVLLDWRVGDAEFGSVREFSLRCKRALEGAGLAEVRLLRELAEGDPAFLATLKDHNHHVGGARMGWSERDGVVDRDLRVFGTENLYVLGPATFRTSSNANTGLLALTLATRWVEGPGQAA